MTRKSTLVVVAFSLALAAGWSDAQPARWSAPATQTPERPDARPMLDAWQALAGDLGPDAMQRMGFAFEGDTRTEWYYTPVERQGFPRGDMNDRQRVLLRRLLETGLGSPGAEKALGAIRVEEVLFRQSGGRAMRNPGLYFLSTFGVPSSSGAWGWRFEGHHLSVNFTVLGDRIVSATPAFFGANPAIVPEGDPDAGFELLAAEQNKAYELLGAFGEGQRNLVISDERPSDILTRNAPSAEMGAPEGIAFGDMTGGQKELLLELLGVFAARMSPELVDYQMAKIRQAGMERVHFVWAGPTTAGEQHYFRIHGPTFVVEWNIQGGGNHIHSVWRDFEDDFGRDPLREHLAEDHGLEVAGITDADSARLGTQAEMLDDDAHRRAHAAGRAHAHAHGAREHH